MSVTPGFGDAVFVSTSFALAGPETINCAEVECCKLPLVAATFSVYVPGGVAFVVVIVSVDVFADASVIEMDVGLNAGVESFDWPPMFSEMFPVKPPAGVAVTV